MTMTENRSENSTTKVLYADSAGSRRRWVLIGLAIAVIAAVGVALVLTTGGGGTKPAKHPSTNPAATATTPTTLSPYALNNNPAPSLAGAYSDNLKTAFLALYAYHDWLYEHPNAALVANYSAPGSPAYKLELGNIEYLIAHHAHAANDPRGLDGDIQFVKVVVAPKAIVGPDGKQAMRDGHPAFQGGILTIVAQYVEDDLYGSTGKFIQAGQHPGTQAIDYSLVQGPTGQWLTYEATVLNPPGGPLSVEK